MPDDLPAAHYVGWTMEEGRAETKSSPTPEQLKILRHNSAVHKPRLAKLLPASLHSRINQVGSSVCQNSCPREVPKETP
jgi:hypothetical protein